MTQPRAPPHPGCVVDVSLLVKLGGGTVSPGDQHWHNFCSPPLPVAYKGSQTLEVFVRNIGIEDMKTQ